MIQSIAINAKKHKGRKQVASSMNQTERISSILPRPGARSRAGSPTLLSHHSPCKLSLLAREGGQLKKNGKAETSRTIIRATWLHLLPGLHLWSIYQVFSLGS